MREGQAEPCSQACAPAQPELPSLGTRVETPAEKLCASGCREVKGLGEQKRALKPPGRRRAKDLSLLLSFVSQWFLAACPQSTWLICFGPSVPGWPPWQQAGPCMVHLQGPPSYARCLVAKPTQNRALSSSRLNNVSVKVLLRLHWEKISPKSPNYSCSPTVLRLPFSKRGRTLLTLRLYLFHLKRVWVVCCELWRFLLVHWRKAINWLWKKKKR